MRIPSFSRGIARLVGIAEPSRRFNKGLQHRLQVESRSANDLEHVGSGSLLLQRFAQFIEQPRVLNRDYSLVGESGDQLGLLVGKWVDFLRPSPKTPIVVPSRRSGTLRVLLYPANS